MSGFQCCGPANYACKEFKGLWDRCQRERVKKAVNYRGFAAVKKKNSI